MRVLALVLLIANILWIAWSFQTRLSDNAHQADPAAEQSYPTLELLSELAELPAQRSNPDLAPETEQIEADANEVDLSFEVEVIDKSIADQSSPRDGEACMRFGPYKQRTQISETEAWMAARNISFWRLDQVFEKRKLLWVYLEPSASESEARERLATLAAQGLDDYMLINRGGLKNSISLGLFSSQESVNRRLSELADKGYQPVVVPRYQDQRIVWFDVAEAQYEEIRSGRGFSLDMPEPEPVLCGQIAASAARQ